MEWGSDSGRRGARDDRSLFGLSGLARRQHRRAERQDRRMQEDRDKRIRDRQMPLKLDAVAAGGPLVLSVA